jgi:hypothetical protein
VSEREKDWADHRAERVLHIWKPGMTEAQLRYLIAEEIRWSYRQGEESVRQAIREALKIEEFLTREGD